MTLNEVSIMVKGLCVNTATLDLGAGILSLHAYKYDGTAARDLRARRHHRQGIDISRTR